MQNYVINWHRKLSFLQETPLYTYASITVMETIIIIILNISLKATDHCSLTVGYDYGTHTVKEKTY